MAEINLLRAEKKKTFHIGMPSQAFGGGLIWLFLGILVATFGVYGVFSFLSNQTSNELNSLNSQIAIAETKIQAPPPEFAQAIKAQSVLDSLSRLLDQHLYWSKLWDKLAQSTFRKIQYLSIAATSDDTRFVLTGTAENYADLGKFILGLQSASEFEDVQILSSAASKGESASGVDFSVAVKFNPSLIRQFSKNNQVP